MKRGEKRAAPRTAVVVVLAIVASAALAAVAPSAAAAGLPGMPTFVHGDVFNWQSVDVYWTASPNNPATSFKVEVRNPTTLAVLDSETCTVSSSSCNGHLLLTTLPASTKMVFWVYGQNNLGTGLPGRSPTAITTTAANTPDRPSGVTPVASSTASTITVQWTMTGDPATKVKIVAYQAGAFVIQTFCLAPCTSSVAVGLTPGLPYRFAIVAENASGSGPSSGPSAEATVGNGPCGSQPYCLTVDGTNTAGGARGRAEGLLHSSKRFADVSRLSTLGITNWRLRIIQSRQTGAFDAAEYENAVRALNVRGVVPTTTLLISDAWYEYTESCPGPQNNPDCGADTPWSNWAAYDAFVHDYVIGVVSKLTTDGVALPDYWEVQNEPDLLPTSANGYRTADRPSATIANVEALFRHAHQAIKAAQSTAKVMGPSIADFAAYPGARNPGTIDLSTFLNFSDANGLVWDAIAWHENAAKADTDWTNDPEEVFVNHTNSVRALIAAHPAQGSPKLVVNEFGPPDRWVVPGWQAGAIAGFEAAGVDFAAHACFDSANETGTGNNCFEDTSTLDGLLARDGLGRYPIWWVDDFYSKMSYDPATASATTTVRSTSSHPSVGVFATRDDANHSVYALVGRNSSCRNDLNDDCSNNDPAPLAPVNIPLTLTFPYAAPTGVNVVIQRIGTTSQNAVITNPELVATFSQAGATVTITLTGVADGDAFTVVVTPN